MFLFLSNYKTFIFQFPNSFGTILGIFQISLFIKYSKNVSNNQTEIKFNKIDSKIQI